MPLFSSASQTEMPPWLLDMYRAAAERSAQLANANYEPYREERLAPVPKELEQAFDLGLQTGEHLPYLQSAEQSIRGTQAPFHQNYKQYMNPYQKEVVEKIAEEGNRNFKEQILPALEAKFVHLGQHGSKRHGKLARKAARDVQGEIASAQAKALAHGYQEASKMYGADQEKAIQTARELASLGALKQAGNLTDIAKLTEQGRIKQQREQTLRDIMYTDYLRKQNYPWQMLQQQGAFLHGIPSQGITTQVQQEASPPQLNLLGQIGNLAANIYGANLRSRAHTARSQGYI